MVSETPTRGFRNPESIESDRVTRAMLSDFLSRRGYAVESDERIRNGQTIVAKAPDGEQLSLLLYDVVALGKQNQFAKSLQKGTRIELAVRAKQAHQCRNRRPPQLRATDRSSPSQEAGSGSVPSSPNRGVGRAFFAIHCFDYLLNADEH